RRAARSRAIVSICWRLAEAAAGSLAAVVAGCAIDAACAGGGADVSTAGRAAAGPGAGSGVCGAGICSAEGRAETGVAHGADVATWSRAGPRYARQAQTAAAGRQAAIATRARLRRLPGDDCARGICALRSAGPSVAAANDGEMRASADRSDAGPPGRASGVSLAAR